MFYEEKKGKGHDLVVLCEAIKTSPTHDTNSIKDLGHKLMKMVNLSLYCFNN
jgi:hypothetical protein